MRRARARIASATRFFCLLDDFLEPRGLVGSLGGVLVVLQLVGLALRLALDRGLARQGGEGLLLLAFLVLHALHLLQRAALAGLGLLVERVELALLRLLCDLLLPLDLLLRAGQCGCACLLVERLARHFKLVARAGLHVACDALLLRLDGLLDRRALRVQALLHTRGRVCPVRSRSDSCSCALAAVAA